MKTFVDGVFTESLFCGRRESCTVSNVDAGLFRGKKQLGSNVKGKDVSAESQVQTVSFFEKLISVCKWRNFPRMLRKQYGRNALCRGFGNLKD